MKLASPKSVLLITLLAITAIAQTPAHPSTPDPHLTERGTLLINGSTTPYLIRRLPISTFTELPTPIAAELTRRACMVPQSYQAHRPENVIHGAFESPTSTDWAVLCSANSRVTLLVFFASSSAATPITLDAADEKSLLQSHDPSGILGFNWGIDAATPAAVHEAQAALDHRPTPPTHDSVALTVLEHRTTYHFYNQGRWTDLEMP